MTELPKSLNEAVHELAVWEREHPSEAAAVRAEHRVELLEVEAEQCAREFAERLWRQRGSAEPGPTDADRAEGEREARTILNQVLAEMK
ncbi:hypothetical protein ACWEVD_00565 [Nocardia thailandica]